MCDRCRLYDSSLLESGDNVGVLKAHVSKICYMTRQPISFFPQHVTAVPVSSAILVLRPIFPATRVDTLIKLAFTLFYFRTYVVNKLSLISQPQWKMPSHVIVAGVMEHICVTVATSMSSASSSTILNPAIAVMLIGLQV